jgi:hypothetical protein
MMSSLLIETGREFRFLLFFGIEELFLLCVLEMGRLFLPAEVILFVGDLWEKSILFKLVSNSGEVVAIPQANVYIIW